MNSARPIGVALCITELDVGGAERCCAELAARLDRRCFNPVVYALSGPPHDRTRSVLHILERAQVPVEFLGGRGARDTWRVVQRLRRRLAVQQPAVVQSFLFHANLVSRFAAPRHQRPLMLAGIRVAERAAGWHLTLDRLTAACVDGYVCVSSQVAEFSRNVGRLPGDKLHVIGNGVDVPAIASAAPAHLDALGVPSNAKVLVAVGRLERQKGLDRLLPLADCWRRGELHDWHLLIVGDGPERDGLDRKFNTLGAQGRVHFVGWRADVPAILRASDLLALPSRWEGMPNVVLEAMAAGLPVAACDVEGVRELLGPLAGEQTAPNDESGAVVALVSRLASDPTVRGKLAAANQVRVVEAFSLDAMVRQYETLWDRLLAERGGS